MSDGLAQLGALLTLALGLMGLVRPDAASAFTNVQPVGVIGRSEIRATYGGFFLLLGATCLATQEPWAFTTVGLAWLGAAAGRLASVVLDESREAQNFGGIAFEGVIGLLLLAPHWLG